MLRLPEADVMIEPGFKIVLLVADKLMTALETSAFPLSSAAIEKVTLETPSASIDVALPEITIVATVALAFAPALPPVALVLEVVVLVVDVLDVPPLELLVVPGLPPPPPHAASTNERAAPSNKFLNFISISKI